MAFGLESIQGSATRAPCSTQQPQSALLLSRSNGSQRVALPCQTRRTKCQWRRERCVHICSVAAKSAEAKTKKDDKKEAAPKESRSELLSPDVGRELYYDMYLGRAFEEMCAQMYYRGKMFGFVHLYSGQEAVSTGAIKCLRPDDYVCSTYRDHVHALSKGVPAREVMAELFGKQTGLCRGQGGSMHMFSRKHNFVSGPPPQSLSDLSLFPEVKLDCR